MVHLGLLYAQQQRSRGKRWSERRPNVDQRLGAAIASPPVGRFLTLARVSASVGVVALITFLYLQLLEVNPTTVALCYLVAILLLATFWGIVEATVASVAAVLCFNFFFLPPVGTLTIADHQN